MITKEEYLELILNELGYQNKINKRIITQLTIHKVSYIIYVYFIINFEKITDDIDFEAWEFGPVIREFWNRYKKFGSLRIDLPYNLEIYKKFEKLISSLHIIRKICDLLTKIEIFDIVNNIHNSKIWQKNYVPAKNIIMTDKMIIDYYKNNDNDLILYLKESL